MKYNDLKYMDHYRAAIALNNAKPVFVDINENNFQMNIELFQKLIKELNLCCNSSLWIS